MREVNGLIPSLFERLTDEHPKSRQEIQQNRQINLKKYREAVLQDILFLLNTTCFQSNDVETVLPYEVKCSTLNYGIPAFSGVNIADIDWEEVESRILIALIRYEPRLESQNLNVLVHLANDNQDKHNQLLIEIKGMLKLNPYPREFWLRTTIDVETGLFSLVDGSVNE